MTKCDINVLYIELSRLLEDICGFLTVELQDGKLSAKAQHEANLLIQRSKKQLVSIAKVSSNNDNDSGRYVDMRPPNETIQENDVSQNDIYSVISDCKPDEEHSDTPLNKNSINVTCPFDDVPVQNIPKNSKHGWLERREKFLFIAHQKKVYASVWKSWMGIYNSDKDNKPLETINLENFEAKVIECPKNNKHMFELVSKNDEFKNVTFNASTKKDVLQWITAINDKRIQNETDTEYEYQGVLNMQKESKFIPVLPPRKSDSTNIIIKKWDPQKRPVPTLPIERSIDDRKPSDIEEEDEDNEEDDDFSETDSNVSYDAILNMSKTNKENHKRNGKNIKEEINEPMYCETNVQDDDIIEEDIEYDEVLNLPLPVKPPIIKQRQHEKPIILPIKPKQKPKPPLKLFK